MNPETETEDLVALDDLMALEQFFWLMTILLEPEANEQS
jgi:hypothetical protein